MPGFGRKAIDTLLENLERLKQRSTRGLISDAWLACAQVRDAVGETSGFGGGGMHGKRSLEGTFLGGCVFSGRIAARTVAAGESIVPPVSGASAALTA